MQNEKENRGVKVGSKRGAYKTTVNKTKAFAGYKYTEDEYTAIREALESYAKQHDCTKSKALYDLITKK